MSNKIEECSWHNLCEKYKDRNLLEELLWISNYPPRGYTSKETSEFLQWLTGKAYEELLKAKEFLPEETELKFSFEKVSPCITVYETTRCNHHEEIHQSDEL